MYINTKFEDFIKEEKQYEELYVFLPYGDQLEEDGILDEYGINKDIYEIGDITEDIAKNVGITILRNKNLSGVLINTKTKEIIGALWVTNENDKYSFDIALDNRYQNIGLSKYLINPAIEEFKLQKEIQNDIGNQNFYMEVDVINPKLAKILKDKYNFYKTTDIDQNRILMSLDID